MKICIHCGREIISDEMDSITCKITNRHLCILCWEDNEDKSIDELFNPKQKEIICKKLNKGQENV